MKRFKNIMVVLNETTIGDRVLDRAIELAAANKAHLTVKVVAYRPTPTFEKMASQNLQEDFEAYVEEKQQKRLDTIKGRARQSVEHVSVDTISEKDTFIAIIRCVLQEQHDLVMLADDEPHSFKEKFFGTTVMHVLRKCPCPVWVFKPSRRIAEPARFPRILAAIDVGGFEEEDEEERALNRKILELATSLAKSEGAELHVIHCWSAYGETLFEAKGGVSSVELNRYLRETRGLHRRRFHELLASFEDRDVTIKPHLIKGDAGLQIPAFATKEKIALVVMGTVARTGISGLLIGNAAEKILQRLGCSLLAVKPDQFVSPVAR